MKNLALSFLFLLVASSFIFGQHSDVSEVSVKKQNKWIRESIKELKIFSPDSTIKPIVLDKYVLDEGMKLSCRVLKSGILKLENGGWIYFKTTSNHQNKEVGDVSMAVDHQKNSYKNLGHVCGGIIHFETTQLTELKETADFFQFFVSHTDSAKWQKVKLKDSTKI